MSHYQASKKHLIPGIRLSRQYKQQSGRKSRQEGYGDVHNVTKQLKLDLSKPLSHALEQVFSHQGTVVLVFQELPHDQVV